MATPDDKTAKLDEEQKNPFDNANDVSDQPSTSEFSVTNPFENQSTIDSLLHPSFSPSVFNTNASSDTDSQKTPNSFWTIDQIAVLKPMDIDLSTLHSQQDFLRLDATSERRAQQAIDEFFASHIEMPSPWSGDRSNSHYLALISPSPAQMKKKANLMTPCTGKPGFSSSSAASSLSSSSQIRVRRLQLTNNGKNPPSSTKTTKDEKIFFKKHAVKNESKNASTQTTLTLPKDFDLEAVLGQYYTFGQVGENQNDTLNNTSLRRKLFFPDGREVKTHDKDGEINLNLLQHIDDIQELDKFAESPVPLQKIQPSSNNVTPLTRGALGEISRTPSTCQSHFSSSPLLSGVGFEHRTPCSTKSGCPRFGSGVRRRKMLLGSSEDEDLMKIQMEALDSPELSPVKGDVFTGVKGQYHFDDVAGPSANVDESMSFNVGEENSHRQEPESSKSPTQEGLPSMESSRRQLVLESPPLSPIEPIKRKSHEKKSLSNKQVNSTQSLALPTNGRSLCPSPMLSPIPCKNALKMAQSDSLGAEQKMNSLLSSTATRPLLIQNEEGSSSAGCVEFTPNRSKSKPFENDEDLQYCGESQDLESNKENIFPSSAVCSSMLSDESQDVSMPLDMTSCNQDLCNDLYMQAEKHSTSVLYCSRGFSSLNPVQTGSTSNQLLSSREPLLHNSGLQTDSKSRSKCQEVTTVTDPCMETSPRKPLTQRSNCAMDVSMSQMQCPALDDSTSSKNLTEYQGDSGYSTTQSNYQPA